MEVGEASTTPDDVTESKPPAQPQHLQLDKPMKEEAMSTTVTLPPPTDAAASATASTFLKRNNGGSHCGHEQQPLKRVKLENNGSSSSEALRSTSAVEEEQNRHKTTAPPPPPPPAPPQPPRPASVEEAAAAVHVEVQPPVAATAQLPPPPATGAVSPGSKSELSRSNVTDSTTSLPSKGGNNRPPPTLTTNDPLKQQQPPNPPAHPDPRPLEKKAAQQPQPPQEEEEVVPLKATHFRHLRHKYLRELEYMLCEFQKLERQLLGAKTAKTAAAAETAGSRERREKLHSFIQHLEETIHQIITGCELEAAGKSTCPPNPDRGDTALSEHLSREKEEEENVQKLEEHILANLLPVKDRLKKQLAAQQGAKHNPAGMPPVRGGIPTNVAQGKATFAPERRPSQLGAGSSLTQKLHGQALAVSATTAATTTAATTTARPPPPVAPQKTTVAKPTEAATTDDTDGEQQQAPKKSILYAGMALGSTQIQSSVDAARTAHNVVIRDPALIQAQSELHASMNDEAEQFTPTSADAPIHHHDDDDLKASSAHIWPGSTDADPAALAQPPIPAADFEDARLSLAAHAAIMSYEERRKLRRKRRKRKKLLRQQQAAALAAVQPSKRKNIIKKRGPRNVEYTCALCNEVYNSTCDCNPWWALSQHECPKCHKTQIPRVDIGAPANAIEYHPALLAHADENGGGGAATHAPESVMLTPPPQLKPESVDPGDVDGLDSDLSDDDGLLSDDDSLDTSDSDPEDFSTMSPADQAENERFGLEYQGPMLTDKDAARLLTLMSHATTCPCRHKNPDHLEVCRSTKWMMLHVRDCPGTTATYDVCPFPWCRKVKHLLYHLVSCTEPDECPICSTANINTNLALLRGLNRYRGIRYQQILVAKQKAAAAAAKAEAQAAAAAKARAITAKAAACKPAAARIAAKPAPTLSTVKAVTVPKSTKNPVASNASMPTVARVVATAPQQQVAAPVAPVKPSVTAAKDTVAPAAPVAPVASAKNPAQQTIPTEKAKSTLAPSVQQSIPAAASNVCPIATTAQSSAAAPTSENKATSIQLEVASATSRILSPGGPTNSWPGGNPTLAVSKPGPDAVAASTVAVVVTTANDPLSNVDKAGDGASSTDAVVVKRERTSPSIVDKSYSAAAPQSTPMVKVEQDDTSPTIKSMEEVPVPKDTTTSASTAKETEGVAATTTTTTTTTANTKIAGNASSEALKVQ